MTIKSRAAVAFGPGDRRCRTSPAREPLPADPAAEIGRAHV